MGLGNFIKTAGKCVVNAVKTAPADVIKSVISFVNDIKDYAYERKIIREEKRQKDSQKLSESLHENKQKVQRKAEQNASNFADNIGDEAIEIDNADANEIRIICRKLLFHKLKELKMI